LFLVELVVGIVAGLHTTGSTNRTNTNRSPPQWPSVNSTSPALTSVATTLHTTGSTNGTTTNRSTSQWPSHYSKSPAHLHHTTIERLTSPAPTIHTDVNLCVIVVSTGIGDVIVKWVIALK
jgi:hypothetical protein